MKIKTILFSLSVSVQLYAQNIEPIQCDRPDQTETPSIVPPKMFQVETGFSFQKNNSNSTTLSMPSTLWKYSVNENFELRLITEFVIEKSNTEKINGLTPIYIGFKTKLTEEKGIFPKTSFIGHVGLPNAASTNFKTDFLAPEFRFAFQHNLTKKMSLSYNLGAEWDGFIAQPTYLYTCATGYTISEKIGSYLEFFGFIPQNKKTSHTFDGGITYLITNNFMIDLSSGIGITKNAPKNYFAFGISFRK